MIWILLVLVAVGLAVLQAGLWGPRPTSRLWLVLYELWHLPFDRRCAACGDFIFRPEDEPWHVYRGKDIHPQCMKRMAWWYCERDDFD